MDNSKSIVSIGGSGFFNSLFLVFLVLKLVKVIDWSWWWVTAPLWIPIVVLLFVLGLIYICYFIVEQGNK